ncbi:GNAT family N-acetyltransferase [Taibaiella sp. KBW10]|uniref:GNAT family N-acetyltransferase n=1 Tax=Taibaiella sp. KBW10 TaxID=2153357 RepID=UPI000F5AE975|nr:GNAT family N-acetyltransferase [Taibaiella sp. KBW10]RQO30874.1 GNAT family N-acetyltransferase [Taibaiella sp. KBW10]
MPDSKIIFRTAGQADVSYATTIINEMEHSAQVRGTGIAKRSPDYIAQKMLEGKSVIALTTTGIWVGFCYIETWSHGAFVANSGLIVNPDFRGHGVAKEIKKQIFNLSKTLYPQAKIFGLTTGLAVMKINSDLGYEPVTYSELTQEEHFWSGCKSCVNYEILMMKERKNCLCTAMMYDPEDHYTASETKQFFKEKNKVLARLLRLKRNNMLGKLLKARALKKEERKSKKEIS